MLGSQTYAKMELLHIAERNAVERSGSIGNNIERFLQTFA